MMEKTLLALAALVSVALGDNKTQHSCHGQPCPKYNVTATNPSFEVRLYPATTWIITPIKSSAIQDVTAAYNRLKAYCVKNGDAGKVIRSTWPGVIRFTTGEGYSMLWFVPGVLVTDDPALSVKVKTIDASIIYARIFHDSASLAKGEDNKKKLIEDLKAAGKDYDETTYFGATYDSLLAIEPHNEIWILAKHS